ncbi:Rossmann-like and DUF2520 domain-containing protein [Janthinobacterium sp. 17J80-10]|uniref:Rossmann-like and DUF2520 domain-containing protein n=1 Tax=Janthinobacterium sp. 17J80-10 TaxID=2497863 RepID=UPI0010059803|nr:Rossmann-like and DUF2520 domain-containing protein [Janthinobacterium sp. 17J80-10]QAU34648.1 DUF2520 domain-containing protein [Janthinobacterium sp. 17J80-10]
MQKTLNIIGAGKLGQALGRLWFDSATFRLHDVLNRSLASAQRAAEFIGAGKAIDNRSELRPADVYLIATPDDRIAASCDALAQSGLLHSGSIVFHCSGALPSSVLQAAAGRGAAVASIHPIRSFAAPAEVVKSFAGTWCGMEGDARALALLAPAFTAIGAHTVPIRADAKIHYHAGAVFASNYLVTLLDVARQSYMRAGIAPDVALLMIAPLVRETVDNVFRLGPEGALTGPIARGDIATAERQRQAVTAADPAHGEIYALFMQLTRELAARRQPVQN